ncbi:MAG: hypothetical protein LBH57_07290, partial [Treponema sp.]|nr:hypothetical protein [Treponema sp.]
MRSAVAISYELDDPAEAAGQLAGSIREKLRLGKHSIGILLCDADTDGAALTGELEKTLGFEIAGMTTLAVLDSGGHHEAAAVLMALTADDCGFFASVSEPLSEGDYERKIADAYRAAGPSEGGYGAGPGVIFAFCPYGMPFSGDRYPDILSRTMPGVPLMGGIASDD